MIAKNVAELIREHVVLEVESIDRMYLNGYVPGLQSEGGLVHFVREHLGYPIASTAVIAPMTERFIRSIERFAPEHRLEVVAFEKGQRKNDVAKQYLARGAFSEGVLFIGRAQEKATVFRTTRRKHPKTGQRYPWITRGSAVPNHYDFYLLDEDCGPLFIKVCAYFPYAVKGCLNGHEWVKRQLAQAGIACTALDNGILWCESPERLQKRCQELDAEKIEAVGKWLARLPPPFRPADRQAGYRYALSIWQAGFSLTQVLDRPPTARPFFEEVIRENLDLGQTVNDTYDFGIGRRLDTLPALREIGLCANRRLLNVQTLSHDGTIGAERFAAVTSPQIQDGQRASALPFGPARVMALMQALCLVALLPTGFRNADLRASMAQLLGERPAHYAPGQLTYDLRRLRLHGLIERAPRAHRYTVTSEGLRIALFFTRAHARCFRPTFALDGPVSPGSATRAFLPASQAVDRLIEEVKLAA